MNKSPSQNSITMTTVHNLCARLLSKCLQNSRRPTGFVFLLDTVLDTGTSERLNYYMNMQRKKEKQNDNKSKFLRYCFELVFIT